MLSLTGGLPPMTTRNVSLKNLFEGIREYTAADNTVDDGTVKK